MRPAGFKYDAVILTQSSYVKPEVSDWFIENLLHEDRVILEALEKRDLKTARLSWDDPHFDWSSARYLIFRSTWDYFDRFVEFSRWLESTRNKTSMVNPYGIIRWNMDKHYLADLRDRGIRIPPTLFIEPGDNRSLSVIARSTGWEDIILKPAVSGGARHTYRLNRDNLPSHESIFRELIAAESMLVQEFQQSILSEGEVTYILFGGKYSHAVQKRAKEGDFRVQDDHGGSVHKYSATDNEVEFAEKVVSACDPIPVYARVDVMKDHQGNPCVSELELIEPELWFRYHPPAIEAFAEAFMEFTGG